MPWGAFALARDLEMIVVRGDHPMQPFWVSSSGGRHAEGKSSCTKVAPHPSAQRQPPPRRCRACAGWFDDVVPRPISCASRLQCLVLVELLVPVLHACRLLVSLAGRPNHLIVSPAAGHLGTRSATRHANWPSSTPCARLASRSRACNSRDVFTVAAAPGGPSGSGDQPSAPCGSGEHSPRSPSRPRRTQSPA